MFFLRRLLLQEGTETAELLSTSQDAAEQLLLLTEEKLAETENDLRSVFGFQKRRDKEWENEKYLLDEKERDLIKRERKLREETNELAALHKIMSVELSGSMKGESMAYSLLKQRETLAERQRQDNENIMRRMEKDLRAAHIELQRERERSKQYSLITGTFIPLPSPGKQSSTLARYLELAEGKADDPHVLGLTLRGSPFRSSSPGRLQSLGQVQSPGRVESPRRKDVMVLDHEQEIFSVLGSPIFLRDPGSFGFLVSPLTERGPRSRDITPNGSPPRSPSKEGRCSVSDARLPPRSPSRDQGPVSPTRLSLMYSYR